MHIWPWHMTLWRWHLVIFYVMSISIIYYHQDPYISSWFLGKQHLMRTSVVCERSCACKQWIWWIIAQTIFHINAYMTLTFDLVTLTLSQLELLINIKNIWKYHQDPSIRSWFIDKKHLMRASVVSGRRPRDNAINLVKRFDPKYDWPSQEVSTRSINTFMSYSQNYFFT